MSASRQKSDINIIIDSTNKDYSSRFKSPEPNKNIETKKTLKTNLINQPKSETITSISSKLIILEKFLKNYELCLLNMFNVKYGALVNFDGFSKILKILGLITNANDFSSQIQRNEEEKTDNMVTNLNTFSKMQIKTKKNNNNADNERVKVKDCWESLNKENHQKIDSNQILIFLSSILGLYDGEEKNEENVKKENNLINHQFLKKLIPEINFENYSYPKSFVKQLKIAYREFNENRMN